MDFLDLDSHRTGMAAAEQFVIVVIDRIRISEPPHTVS